jgi:hypothetical protein
MTLKILPFTPMPKSFLQRPTRHNESKAEEKSIKEQNNFFFLERNFSMRK